LLEICSMRTDPTDLIYACPLHPEVRQSHPGHCYQCGMQLEAKGRGKQAKDPGTHR
jgi:P-type Cu+ transporter